MEFITIKKTTEMKAINFYDYSYNAITESIKALNDHKDVKNYYGDNEECTIESYFASQINEGNIYDHFEEYSEEFLIGSVEDLRVDFEVAREDAFKEYLSEKWKDYYEEEIRDFLDENYFETGDEIGIDYSVYIDMTGINVYKNEHRV